MKTQHLLTTHLPDFMKMDLGLGSDQAHPLPAVLDAWLSEQAHHSALQIFCAQSGLGSQRTETREFLSHGFIVEQLSEAQKNAFYRELKALLSQRLQLSALETLARIYFGEASVRRGHPYVKQTLSASSRLPLRLSEANDSNTLLFVEAGSPVGETLAQEFLHNAQRLVPPHFRVKLCGPRVDSSTHLNVISLKESTRMKGWTL